MLKVGDTAPDFALADQHGETVRLSELLRESAVIVYFYPADFSPVCTAQACGLRDSFAGLEQVSVKIVGISPQSVKSHDQFATRYDLPFPLLADTSKAVIRQYGVDAMFGFGVRRATFLVGTDGVVHKRVVADFGTASHIELLEETAREA